MNVCVLSWARAKELSSLYLGRLRLRNGNWRNDEVTQPSLGCEALRLQLQIYPGGEGRGGDTRATMTDAKEIVPICSLQSHTLLKIPSILPLCYMMGIQHMILFGLKKNS